MSALHKNRIYNSQIKTYLRYRLIPDVHYRSCKRLCVLNDIDVFVDRQLKTSNVSKK